MALTSPPAAEDEPDAPIEPEELEAPAPVEPEEPEDPEVPVAKAGADRPRHSAQERAMIFFMAVPVSKYVEELKPETPAT